MLIEYLNLFVNNLNKCAVRNYIYLYTVINYIYLPTVHCHKRYTVYLPTVHCHKHFIFMLYKEISTYVCNLWEVTF